MGEAVDRPAVDVHLPSASAAAISSTNAAMSACGTCGSAPP
jgi:hypothetical protein